MLFSVKQRYASLAFKLFYVFWAFQKEKTFVSKQKSVSRNGTEQILLITNCKQIFSKQPFCDHVRRIFYWRAECQLIHPGSQKNYLTLLHWHRNLLIFLFSCWAVLAWAWLGKTNRFLFISFFIFLRVY